MAQMNVTINFSTNAKVVKQQIRDLDAQVSNIQSSTARLAKALDTGKASSKNLSGDIRARKTIVKLDTQINELAKQRANSITRGYNFGAQQNYIKGLVQTTEKLRIQRKILDDNANAWVNLGKNTQWAGRQLVVGFTVPLTIAAGAAMKAFSDLEKELVKFKRVYGDINTTNEQTDAMADSVKGLANEWVKYGVAVSDTIGLAAEAAGAGFQDKKLIAQVESANKLAVLGQLEQQKAMAATIAMQSTFKMSNADLAQSIDYLNQLENQTMVTMEDMTTAIPKAATVVEGLGGSVEDLGTMMAALREGGVSAAEGANALKSGLGSLLNPSKAAAEALSSIGVNVPKLWEQAEENGKGVIYVVEQLGSALDTLGSTKKQQIMEELFGKHQFARMNALLTNINKGTQALQAKEVQAATPLERALTAQKELGKLGESSLTKFQSAVQQLKAAIAPLGKMIMDVVTPLIDFATKGLNWFNNLPDIVKKMTVGFAALAGVAAPLFLMLLGQVQNLIGNGLKLLNWLRNFGKDTKWVSYENLTLAQTIDKVNAQLIAENAVLIENTALWKQRGAAATGSVAASSRAVAPVPGKRGAKPKGFAKGGSVGGSGSGDTVPALLTPGEFVVNKKASQQYGSILGAMNSGNIQGLALGISKVLPFVGKNAKANTAAEERDIRQRRAEEKIARQEQEKLSALKARSEAKLMAFKNREMSAIGLIISQVGSAIGATTSQMAKLYPFTQWDQSHINPAETNKLKSLSDAEILKLQASGKLGLTAKPRVGPRGKLLPTTKLWNYSGNIIMDNHAINDLGVPEAGYHPLTVNEIKATANLLGERYKETGKAKFLVTQEIAKWRASHGGSQFYKDLLDDNFIFMNLHGATRKRQELQEQARKTKLNQGLLSTKEFNARYMASGGFVPGSGNKDTVPAMLTPGEAVINKKASKKFAPILHAMNKGKLGMFAGGRTSGDSGADKNWTPDEVYPKQEIKDAMEAWRAQIDAIVQNFREINQITDDEAAELKKTLQERYAKEGQASHIVPEFDEEGNKVYRRSNTVVTSQLENNAMTQLAKSKNMNALQQASEKLIADTKLAGASAEQLAKQQTEYTNVLQTLEKGEHLVDDAQRKYASQMILQAEQMGLLTNKTQANAKAIAAGLLVPVQNLEGQAGSTALAEQERAAILARGHYTERPGSSGKPTDVDIDDDRERGQRDANKARRFDPSNLLFVLPMITSQFEGLNESMGSFNEALAIATTAMFGMQAFGIQGIPTGGGFKGILGNGTPKAGAGRLGKAFSKWGLGAGGIAGTAGLVAGGLAGNAIQDGRGGARDAAGQAVSWGAAGAGLGLMFGPWGAAIGGAAGALAGFTVQVLANSKAQKEMNESVMNASQKWQDAIDALDKQLNLGKNKSLEELLGGLNVGKDEHQQELYEVFSEQIKTKDDPLNVMLEDIKKRLQAGKTTVAGEMNTFALGYRAKGAQESDIELMVKGIIAALPENLRGGLNPSTYSLPDTSTMVSQLNDTVSKFVNSPLIQTYRETPRSGPTRYGVTGDLTPETRKNFNLDEVVTTTNQLADATRSLETVQLNAANAMAQNARDTKEYKDAQKQYNDAEKNLVELRKTSRTYEEQMMLGGETAQNKYFETLDQRINNVISKGQGQGIEKDKGLWKEYLKTATENSDYSAAELTQAAEMALQAGIDLRDSAGNLTMSARSLMVIGDGLRSLNVANADLAAVRNEQASITGALGIIEDLQNNPPEKPKKTDVDRAQAALDKAQEKEDARQHKWAKINQGWTIKNATLDIARIHLEEKALKGFVKKFNKAFGTSIDSFADAQYQIEKIGLAIRKIQVKTIEPLQEKADDLRRVNELRARKLDELQEKEQARVDSINESYDKQAEILERIAKEQQFIADEAGAAADLQSAYAGGNIADITKAGITLNKTVSEYGRQQSTDLLEKGRAAELSNSPYRAEIDALTKSIKATEKEILSIEDQIYNINEKQIEPLQRRSDLMSLMLDSTKSVLENQKANINGIDQENLARKEALKSSKQALDDARHMFDLRGEQLRLAKAQKKVEEDTNTVVNDRLAAVKELTNLQTDNLEKQKTALLTLEADAKTRETRIIDVITGIEKAMRVAAEGSQYAVDAWGQPVVPGTPIATLAQIAEYIRTGEVPEQKKGKAAPTWKDLPEWKTDPGTWYTGGTIPGSGGQDSVKALLTPGEFVMRKSAVKKIGVNKLAALNRGGTDYPDTNANSTQKYAAGGLVLGGLYNEVEKGALEKISEEPRIIDALRRMNEASEPSGPSGPPTGNAAKGAAGAVNYLLSNLGASSLPLIGLTSVLNKCLTIVGRLYEKFVGGFTAPRAADPIRRVAGMRAAGIQFHSGYNAPKGAMYWYGGGANGHVGFSDGNGNIVGNYGGNYVERLPANLRRPYYGWTSKMSNGGLVPGRGNGDTMPSMLTPGEFVIRKAVVDRVGTLPLKKLNAMATIDSGAQFRNSGADGDAVVYNNYELNFDIQEATNANEIVNVVVREIQRLGSSKVKTR